MTDQDRQDSSDLVDGILERREEILDPPRMGHRLVNDGQEPIDMGNVVTLNPGAVIDVDMTRAEVEESFGGEIPDGLSVYPCVMPREG